MITVKDLTKRFSGYTALDHITCTVSDGCIYGMVGSNGAGKSTFLRLLAGVYRPDSGSILLDGAAMWENPEAKSRIAYVSDEPYFINHSDLDDMERMYRALFPRFDKEKFRKLTDDFSLDRRKPVNSFSKGMKRQAATALALSRSPDYIFFDETFDGLDPIMRSRVKNLISADVLDRGASAVITSHSLRELEDTCDQLALLHKGGIVLESDVANLKTEQFKVQIAFDGDYDKTRFEGVDHLHFVKHGSVASFIARGDRREVSEKLKALKPTLLDILPLSLEEVFTYELEALGYSIDPEENVGGMNDEK